MKHLWLIVVVMLLVAFFILASVSNYEHKKNEQTIMEQNWEIERLVQLGNIGDTDQFRSYCEQNIRTKKHLCACVLFTEDMLMYREGKLYRYVHGFWKLIPKYNFAPKNRRD